MRKVKWTDALNISVNVGVVFLLAYFLVRPGGAVHDAVSDWREEVAMNRIILTDWEDMISVGGRLYGNDGGPVVLEFSDYECPFCKAAHEKLPEVMDSVGAQLVYLHFPLTRTHPAAEGAAKASICAEYQGRFSEMHERLFATDEWRSDEDWMREAEEIEVPDLDRFGACLESKAVLDRLARDRAIAERLKVRATPTFVSTGGRKLGVLDVEGLKKILK